MFNRIRALAHLRVAALAAALTVAATGSAQITTYGDNASGQLTIPGDVTKYVKVLNGDQNAAVLNLDGSIRIWGASGTGFVNGTTGRGYIDASMGPNNIIALKSDGTVSVFGYPYYGASNIPAGLNGVVAVSSGGEHMMTLKSDGSIVSWGGSNGNGERNTPAGLHDIVAISAGYGFSSALQSDGTVRVWGNISGTYTGVVAISAGALNLMMLKSDGTVEVIGSNFFGALNVPPEVSNVVSVACAGYHCMAIKADGTVAAWGWNQYGQCSGPNGFVGAKAIAPGSGSSMVVQGDYVKPALSLLSMAGGSTLKLTGIVKLGAPALSDTVVTLGSSDSEVVAPPTVTIRAGDYSTAFNVTTSAVTTTKHVRFTASVNGLGTSTMIEVQPMGVNSIKLAATSTYGGTSGDVLATVTLNALPNTPVTVNLSSSDTSLATVPASVVIPAKSKTATFIVSTKTVNKAGFATIQATAGGDPKSTRLKVMPEIGLSAFTMTPMLYGTQVGIGKVTLRYPAQAGGVDVNVSVAGSGLFILSPVVHVDEGQSSASFQVIADELSIPAMPIVQASFGVTQLTAPVAVNPLRIVGVSCTTKVVGGSTVSGTVSLNQAVDNPTYVYVTVISGGDYATGVPTLILIPAGSRSATFSFATSTVTANRKLQIMFSKVDSIVKTFTVTP